MLPVFAAEGYTDPMAKQSTIRVLVENRRARHEYQITDTLEAGLSLLGSEVKSIRAGQANLAEAYVTLRKSGAWLVRAHISPYEQANSFNHEPRRDRQLLLNGHELSRLRKATAIKGLTIVPLKLVLKGSLIKLNIGIGRGKKQHDKRHALKEQQQKREMDRGRR